MMDITLTADEHLIEAARERARRENMTLDSAFRLWLSDYVAQPNRVAEFDAAVSAVCGKLKVGKRLSRDEMNAR